MPSPPDVLSTGSVSEKRVWELIADYVGGGGGGGSITSIASADGSVTITSPTGPTPNLSVPKYGTWQAFTPATTGISSENVLIARYTQIGKLVVVQYSVSGTSTGTGVKTFTLPKPSITGANLAVFPCIVEDNGATLDAPGSLALASASSAASISPKLSGGTWTASGAWACLCCFMYETP